MTNPAREEVIVKHRQFYESIRNSDDLRKAAPRLPSLYSDRIDILGRLLKGRSFTGDWRVFNGLTVLDLGCGWEWDPPSPDKLFAPHISRILAGQGADVYGIDTVGANDPDFFLFTHIIADIVPWIMEKKLHELKGLGGKVDTIKGFRFDIVNCHGVLGNSPDPGMEDHLERMGIPLRTVTRSLLEQTANLLKENGILALDNHFYRMTNNRLRKILNSRIPY